ncbi:MAG: MFS transporter [Nitratireductor sp.]|nr:MFS transporter [Paracoccaceae bacterium]MCB1386014.1 MFS transporter [Nitratireductor sp.]
MTDRAGSPAEAAFETPPPGFAPRMAAGYCAYFLYVGLYTPYFPVWLKAQALNPAEISAVLSAALIVRVLGLNQVMVFADRFRDRAVLLTRLYWMAAASVMLFLAATNFWSILIVAALYNLFFNPVLPLLDAIVMAGVRRFDADYGRIRIWGSLMFTAANLTGGWLLAEGPAEFILYTLLSCMVLGAIASSAIPRIGRRTPPADIALEARTRRRLLANRPFLLTLAACGLAQASHSLLYGFGTIHWQALNYSGFAIGAFWAVGVATEIVLFRFAKRLLKVLPPPAVIALGCIGGAVRWSLFPVAGGETAFLLLQALHGLSFGAVHIGLMHFIMEAVPEENLGAAQGAGFVLGGIFMGVGVFFAGPLYAALGGDGYWVMAAVCIAALAILALARRSGGFPSTP